MHRHFSLITCKSWIIQIQSKYQWEMTRWGLASTGDRNPVKVTLLWMSLAVFICSIFYADHPSGELLHILFLAFILSRSQRWCSWCENTKGSRFICHAASTSDQPLSIPYLLFNVTGLWIPQCTRACMVALSQTPRSYAKTETTVCGRFLADITSCFVFLI